MGWQALQWASLDSVEGSRTPCGTCKLLIVILIYAASIDLSGFGKPPQLLPVPRVAKTRAGTFRACRRSHPSFKSELPIKEGQRV
ncbi:hypothetical protein DMW99_10345 [Pseudomonas chlororaphis]|nr:hypothetical protein C1Y36_15005 [Pseudomonas sp. FW306-2-2C-D06C]PYC39648.1 hypothetical protein DMW99_10345 [Pseudomonas chlororaphis]